jgi:hypothetical protein
MRRYQVALEGKDWDSRGPDLLRRRENAVDATLELCRDRRETWVGRVIRTKAAGVEWQTIGKRRRLEAWLSDALESAPAGSRIQVGFRRWDDVVVRAVVRTREVEIAELVGANAGVEITNALLAAAFPTSIFAGGFVCKQIDGSSSWSDHAWGDAGDRTQNEPKAPNDALTDWLARMAATGNVPIAPAGYLLGSKDGRVVEAKRRVVGSWALTPSSASSSHLWHVHYSTRDHNGARPPCA